MFLTLKFDETLDFPKPGETQLRLDLLDASPLRQFFSVTLTRLEEGTTDKLLTLHIPSGEFLKEGGQTAKQKELFKVLGLAVAAAMPQKEQVS